MKTYKLLRDNPEYRVAQQFLELWMGRRKRGVIEPIGSYAYSVISYIFRTLILPELYGTQTKNN